MVERDTNVVTFGDEVVVDLFCIRQRCHIKKERGRH
jgi:hypothetical protein